MLTNYQQGSATKTINARNKKYTNVKKEKIEQPAEGESSARARVNQPVRSDDKREYSEYVDDVRHPAGLIDNKGAAQTESNVSKGEEGEQSREGETDTGYHARPGGNTMGGTSTTPTNGPAALPLRSSEQPQPGGSQDNEGAGGDGYGERSRS